MCIHLDWVAFIPVRDNNVCSILPASLEYLWVIFPLTFQFGENLLYESACTPEAEWETTVFFCSVMILVEQSNLRLGTQRLERYLHSKFRKARKPHVLKNNSREKAKIILGLREIPTTDTYSLLWTGILPVWFIKCFIIQQCSCPLNIYVGVKL